MSSGSKIVRQPRAQLERAISRDDSELPSSAEVIHDPAEQAKGSSGLSVPLRQVQAWLQTFITAEGDTNQAVTAAQEASGRGDVGPTQLILPSLRLNPQQLLMIYRNQYLLRMDEALGIDFPVAQKYLGEVRFFQLVRQYVERYPSRSWTLNHLGVSMVRFLEELQQEQPSFDKRFRLLIDIARVEWALAELHDEPEDASLTLEQIASIDPSSWANSRLGPIRALRLLELEYPVHSWLNAERDGQPLPPIRPRATRLILWSQGGDLWRQPLDPGPFALLRRLVEGQLVGEAMDAVLAGYKTSPQKLFSAFSNWLNDGLFTEVTLS